MPHKYDLFIEIAKKGSLKSKEINISNKNYYLEELEKEGLIIKNKEIKVKNNKKTQNLYSLLRYCLNNNLNYRFYTKNTTLQFLEDYFCNKKVTISLNTESNIREQLWKDTFLVYFSKKPLDYIILNHTFFKELLSYYDKEYCERNIPKTSVLNKVSNIRPKRILEKNISFIHTSLQLEGNLLTLRETQKVLKEETLKDEVRTKDIFETVNYDEAIKYSKSLNKISYDELLNIHSIVMRHEGHAGKIRSENVVIKNNPSFKILSYKTINKELNKLLGILNDHSKKSVFEICENASFIHNQLQYIHPFLDGNSRTTRLITQWYFERHKLAFDIPLGFTTHYTNQTKGYKNRDDSELTIIFCLIIISLSYLS